MYHNEHHHQYNSMSVVEYSQSQGNTLPQAAHFLPAHSIAYQHHHSNVQQDHYIHSFSSSSSFHTSAPQSSTIDASSKIHDYECATQPSFPPTYHAQNSQENLHSTINETSAFSSAAVKTKLPSAAQLEGQSTVAPNLGMSNTVGSIQQNVLNSFSDSVNNTTTPPFGGLPPIASKHNQQNDKQQQKPVVMSNQRFNFINIDEGAFTKKDSKGKQPSSSSSSSGSRSSSSSSALSTPVPIPISSGNAATFRLPDIACMGADCDSPNSDDTPAQQCDTADGSAEPEEPRYVISSNQKNYK